MDIKHTLGAWEVGLVTTGDGLEISGQAYVTMGDEEDPECEADIRGRKAKANAALIAAAPVLLDSLIKVRALIVEAAATGFNCHDGDWAERLFASQSFTHDAVTKATNGPR